MSRIFALGAHLRKSTPGGYTDRVLVTYKVFPTKEAAVGAWVLELQDQNADFTIQQVHAVEVAPHTIAAAAAAQAEEIAGSDSD